MTVVTSLDASGLEVHQGEGKVLLSFPCSVDWLTLTPAQALAYGGRIIKAAMEQMEEDDDGRIQASEGRAGGTQDQPVRAAR
jgi:hypothetical protein